MSVSSCLNKAVRIKDALYLLSSDNSTKTSENSGIIPVNLIKSFRISEITSSKIFKGNQPYLIGSSILLLSVIPVLKRIEGV